MESSQNQLKILILDDDPARHNRFEKLIFGQLVLHVFTSKECIKQLEQESWDVCFLDHDLGGQVYVESGENTGFEVAKWLEENPNNLPKKIIIHSFNPVGAENMKKCLPSAHRIPVSMINEENISQILEVCI